MKDLEKKSKEAIKVMVEKGRSRPMLCE